MSRVQPEFVISSADLNPSMFDLFRLEAEDKLRELDAGLQQLLHGAAPGKPLATCVYAANALKDAAHMAGLPMVVSLVELLEDCFGAAQRGRLVVRETTLSAFQRSVELLARIARAPQAEAGQWGGEMRAEVEVLISVLKRLRDGQRETSVAEPRIAKTAAPLTATWKAADAAAPVIPAEMAKLPVSATWPERSVPRAPRAAPPAAGDSEDPSASALASTWPEHGKPAVTPVKFAAPVAAAAVAPAPTPAPWPGDDESSLFDLFKQEAEDLSQALHANLRVLRHDPYAPRQLESCTRAAHSFKGAARICGLTMIVGLARALEECFSAAEKKTIDLKRDSLDLLAATVDLLARVAQQPSADAGQWGGAQRAEVESYLHALQRLRAGEGPVEIPTSSGAAL